jgi:hypothetical protein
MTGITIIKSSRTLLARLALDFSKVRNYLHSSLFRITGRTGKAALPVSHSLPAIV